MSDFPDDFVKLPDSFLGTAPICDICKKDIVVGDVVRQEFIGPVTRSEYDGELGISEKYYVLVHTSCEGR